MEDEKEVIAACKSGDVNSYRYLVEKYKKRAYYNALTFTYNRDDALELSQEAFYRAYRALHTFHTEGDFYSWFYRILRNVCLNFIRQKKRKAGRSSSLYDGGYGTNEESPDQILEKNENNRLLWKAINELKDEQREIILLKEFDGCSYKQIAERLDIPIGSVMSRLYYARKRLLTIMEGFYDEA